MVTSEVLNFIKKVPLFATLSKSKIDVLTKSIVLKTYTTGLKIITQGEEDSQFYIIKKGKVDIVVNNNYIRTLNETESFGERALFFKERRSASAMANGDVEVFVLAEKDFKGILEDNLKEFLVKRLLLQDNTVEMDDLNYVSVLGHGNFGNVYLVQSKKNKALYAIKGIDKIQINAEILHKNLELERAILLKIDHPFIVKLVKTLKDKNFIYFLMEHIVGKELFDVIREIGLLDKPQTQFYGCSIMLAVDYLHERKCIYRDIKPENILITEMVR
jgi:cGMP-dependent protein kinase